MKASDLLEDAKRRAEEIQVKTVLCLAVANRKTDPSAVLPNFPIAKGNSRLYMHKPGIQHNIIM